ncbi:methyltransferase domain-containing protein [Qipengyuania sphaerica]|uniref:methyltransferase domain-containing protein n=1 Tax=Qipengyuania sphaerica TaxID=2867243 RepID=UPI001C882987|nr:class I SAM-dependent methyltransferase [Qipengyuania sphaerica]MBX7541685.1 class I SAM-dependent methyltransferase [Qipengyuania sphaerica]
MSSTLTEHYRYLAMSGRTEAYRRALRAIVEKGDVVADLGCGFGILGMLALEAGASHCYGIDHSRAAHIARETVRRKGLEDRFTVIHGSTFEVDLPEQVDLILCDHIGHFGVDYGIARLMEDARRRFLKPGGRMMPQNLRVDVALARNPKGRGRIHRWQREGIPDAYRWLDELEVNELMPLRMTAEDLLSAGAPVAELDFAQQPSSTFALSTRLVAQCDALVDGLCGYFSCKLAPQITLTNDPRDAQAIPRSTILLPTREPFAVREGEEVEVSLSIRDDPWVVSWALTPPGGEKQQMSTLNAAALTRG